MTLPRITATGNIGGEPELKFTQSGKAILNFSLGCNENKKNDAGEWETVSTTWLRIALWGDEAEAAADVLAKGQKVTVNGLLMAREYERNDGTKGTSLEVKYAEVAVAIPKPKNGSQNRQQQASGWDSPPSAQPKTDAWGQTAGNNDKPPF